MTIYKSLCLTLIVLAGCGEPYGVTTISDDAPFRAPQSSAVSDGRLSEQSSLYIRRHALQDALQKSPRDAIDQMAAGYGKQPSRPAAFVLAELCYLEGARHRATSDEAGRSFLSSAIFAYAFLFDPQLPGLCSPFDRRYSVACDIYNRALSKALARHPLSGSDWGEAATLQSFVGPVRIVQHSWKLPWPKSHFNRFESAYHFKVTGIEDPARQQGVGVPLIAFRSQANADPSANADPFLQKLPTRVLAATMCVRFHGSAAAAMADRNSELTADFSMLDPMVDSTVEISGRAIPIEADVATPLAFSIEHAPRLSGFKGFMDTTSWGDRHGLFMNHPYQPGKIPVVFVYGLTGKPTTWVPMFNHLVANETIRSRFQFWYFMYPTGNPVLYSAAVLRGELNKAKQLFDPDGSDPAFNQMVVVGHSMGGLVTRLQVMDSGDDVWNAVMSRPFDSTRPADPTSDLIKSAFFFKSHPFVKRAIFMATPHRGSALADSWLAREVSSEVTLADDVRLAEEQYVLPAMDAQPSKGQTATAVESLSAENPVLLAIDRVPISPWVKYHSVIANRKSAGQPGGTDSIVPYTSSHLDDAVTETIIHSKHSCTRNPDAIREVERLLMLHLADIDAGINHRKPG